MRPYRIGLMAVHSEIDYPYSMRMGVQNTIEDAGHVLVPIAEMIPYHTLYGAEGYLRVATEIAIRLNLDCVIMPLGCMAAYLRRDAGTAIDKATVLAHEMSPATTLIVDRELPGYRSVGKDNLPGMHDCMRHLIETCGFTKIAFVSGPESSKGAQEREAVYLEEMEAHGLRVEEGFLVRGNFAGSCPEVIEQILDTHPDIQAIACACDLMAYTAYDVLRRRGIRVGEDVAITGFDDNPRSAAMDPPLSTVHMTSYDLGCMAAREALRLCAGQPQEERVLNSSFVARSSCGEGEHGGVAYYRSLISRDPFPADEIVDAMVDATLSMAGSRETADFRAQMAHFLEKIREAYHRHLDHPDEDVLLFSSQDLSALFSQDYREHLSLEGFHRVAIMLLEALVEESEGEDAGWVIEQVSHLHLRIARLLNNAMEMRTLAMNKREWNTFHMVDSSLREERDPAKSYEGILRQFAHLGVREADVFLLPEPVEFIGTHSFALSDELRPIGRVADGEVEVMADAAPIAFQGLLDYVLPRYRPGAICTVGGVMAGHELIGVAAIDAGALSLNDQLMAYLNLGFALKHLQMIAHEHEMNAILSKSNLLLEQQSQHDELTGLLNRRGFVSLFEHEVSVRQGSRGAVLYLDLDGLKTINDTLGHDVGDDAIRETARLLKRRMPEDGLLSRLGGDEYAAFLPAVDEEDVERLVRDVQADMAARNERTSAPYQLSISVGWACFEIDETTQERRAELLAQADERLYEMKRQHHARRARSS